MSAAQQTAKAPEPEHERLLTPDEWGVWADNIWMNEKRHVGWAELIEAVQANARRFP